MSLLVIGLSHHRATINQLEGMALDADGRAALVAAACRGENVAEAIVVSTCNRTEVYCEAVTFHGAVSEITDLLLADTGADRDDVHDRLYLHYEDRAIAHAFRVASGLDSMALGESQIRAQMRSSLREAQGSRHVGPALNTLFQQALRVGKRVHHETQLGSVSYSLVDAGLRLGEEHLGDLGSASVLIVGAGAMAALSATAAGRAGAGQVVVANRTLARGQALAERVGGRAVRLSDLPEALAGADLVISCVGSPGLVLTAADAHGAQQVRGGAAQVYVDLAMPHDIAHDVAELAGVSRFGLDDVGARLRDRRELPAVIEAEHIVTGEVAGYLAARASDVAAPTIAALRSRANDVLAAELSRMEDRTPDLTPAQRHEVEVAMGRLVDKLLHTPTVRAKELAARGSIAAYAEALDALFALDPHALAAVESPAGLVDGDGLGGAR
ncbi:MAG: glutamyl-tRNA reductase [Tetrasphaera sp.]